MILNKLVFLQFVKYFLYDEWFKKCFTQILNRIKGFADWNKVWKLSEPESKDIHAYYELKEYKFRVILRVDYKLMTQSNLANCIDLICFWTVNVLIVFINFWFFKFLLVAYTDLNIVSCTYAYVFQEAFFRKFFEEFYFKIYYYIVENIKSKLLLISKNLNCIVNW